MLRSVRSLMRLRALATTGASVSKVQVATLAPLWMCSRRAFSTPVDDTPKQQQKIKPQSHPLRKQQGSATPPKSPQSEGPTEIVMGDYHFDTDAEIGQLAKVLYEEASHDDNTFKKTVEDLLRFVKTLQTDLDLQSAYEMETTPSSQALLEQLMNELCAGFAPEAQHFIAYLQANNKGALLPSIVKHLQAAYNHKYQIHFFNVTLAEYNSKLNDRLAKFFDDVVPTGHSYNLAIKADPDILGGMLVELEGGGRADFSIANVITNAVIKKSEEELRYESL